MSARARRGARYLAVSLAWALAACAPEAPKPPPQDAFVPLFDGESLEGWRRVGGQASYRVEDGAIVGEVGPGLNTFLRTERSFGDFVLTLRFRVDVANNSGIQFRSRQREADGVVTGYQFEIDPSERGWSGGLYDESGSGWLAPPAPALAAQTPLRQGDWNEARIEAVGPRLRTWLNGVAVADLLHAAELEGFVALQMHAGERGRIRWRDIRIQELGEALRWRRLFDGESADGWEARGPGTWSARAGTLRGALEPGAPREALLLSDGRFRDFALRLRFRADRGRGALRVRAAKGGADEAPGGLSIALDAAGGLAEIAGADGAPLARPAPEDLEDALGRAGSGWNALEVVAIGDRVAVAVNGRPLADVRDASLADRGAVALALAPPGAQLRFADIELLDLAAGAGEQDLPPALRDLVRPPAPVLSPEQARSAFRVAPGFRVELVAAEPLVEDPVAIDWDARGRLYVVEMRGYMPNVAGDGEDAPVGRVVVLADADGDGRMDESHVYLDGLVMPRAVRVLPEGVLIGEPPNLWLCRDRGGDPSCDEKRRLGDYAPERENPEYAENGLLYGLDGRLYNAKSDRRFALEGDALRVERAAFRGQWGIDKDARGRLLYNTNSNFVHADFFPAEYLLRHPETDPALRPQPGFSELLALGEEVHPIRVTPGTNRAYLEGSLRPDGRQALPTAACGPAVLRSEALGPELAGDVFVPEPSVNAVAQFALREEGLALRAEHRLYDDPDWGVREFLASTDERFRPVSAALGPEGALYVVDMYRGVIQHAEYVSEYLRRYVEEQGLEKPLGHGRIWRVVREGAPAPRPRFDAARASAAERVAALADPNGRVRDAAQQWLVHAADPASLPLLRALDGREPVAKVHALHALARMGALDADTWRRALADADPRVRAAALRAGEPLLAEPGGIAAVSALAEDADPHVRLQLALSLGEHAEQEAAREGMARVLERDAEQPIVRVGVLSGLAGHELDFLEHLLASARWAGEAPGRRAFLSLLARGAFARLAGAPGEDAAATAERERLFVRLGELPGQGPLAWRAQALLEGIAEAASAPGFQPMALVAQPALFAGGGEQRSDAFRSAVQRARRGVTWPGDESLPGAAPLSEEQKARMARGRELYAACATCHQSHGRGQPGLAPSLVGSPWVLDADAWLIRIVLHGVTGPLVVDGEQWNADMPGHALDPRFDDEAVAGLATWLRRAWGHRGDPIDPETVAAVRTETARRAGPWTAAELRALPVEHKIDRYVGRYKISDIPIWLTVRREGTDLVMAATGQGERVIDRGPGPGEFLAEDGGMQLPITFLEDEAGAVSGLRIVRAGQKIHFDRVD